MIILVKEGCVIYWGVTYWIKFWQLTCSIVIKFYSVWHAPIYYGLQPYLYSFGGGYPLCVHMVVDGNGVDPTDQLSPYAFAYRMSYTSCVSIQVIDVSVCCSIRQLLRCVYRIAFSSDDFSITHPHATLFRGYSSFQGMCSHTTLRGTLGKLFAGSVERSYAET